MTLAECKKANNKKVICSSCIAIGCTSCPLRKLTIELDNLCTNAKLAIYADSVYSNRGNPESECFFRIQLRNRTLGKIRTVIKNDFKKGIKEIEGKIRKALT